MVDAAMCSTSQRQTDLVNARAAALRRAAIAEYAVLDTVQERAFDDIAQLAATAFESPMAAISFIDDDRQWFKAEVGIGVRETPIAQSFCAHAIEQEGAFVVLDASEDHRFATNPLVTEDPHLRFYAGMPVLAHDGTAIGALCVLDRRPRPEGITEAQRSILGKLARQVQTQLELRRALDHDPLTGLLNRAAFHALLTRELSSERPVAQGAALMLLDVDHFKQVNDAIGHDAGDALLRAFARRLKAGVRQGDVVARLGGDEFGVLFRGIDSEARLAALLPSLKSRLREPVEHAGRTIECNSSMGVALYPCHASDVVSLTKCSDLALAAAKIDRDKAVTYRRALGDSFRRDTKLLKIARSVVRRHDLVPHYQPKVDFLSGEIAGYEALARWQRGGRAMAHSDMFAQIFSSPGLAIKAGEQLVAQVLDDIRLWTDAGVSFGHVAINTCAADFASNDYAERLLAALNVRGINPCSIEVEVTEGVFLGRGAHHVARALTLLSGEGIRIALDDFGTGYASLTHLKQFPVDVIKIDRAFLAGIGRNADDAAIVRAVLGLGASLGMVTVAEGIETQEQAAFARMHGCTYGQGFLYGRALPASDIPTLSRQWQWQDAA